METIGWIGSILFALCGLPQAIQSVQDKHSNGLSWGFLAMWGMGEILTLIYVFPKADWPLISNYAANLGFLTVILFYKVFPK